MKKQSFFNSLILCFIVTFSVFFTLISCGNGVTETKKSEDDKVIIRFSVEDSARTVLPGKVDVNAFTNIYLYCYSANSEGFGRSYNNMQQLQDDTLTLDSSEIGNYYNFDIIASNGNRSFRASINDYRISRGENILNFVFTSSNLGQGHGSVDISIDFSSASTCTEVNHAEVFVRPIHGGDVVYSATVFERQSEDVNVAHFEASDIPAGAYNAEVVFYATSSELAPILKYPFILQVAENATSSSTLTVNAFYPAYNIVYDMNAGENANIIFDYEANSKITNFSKVKPSEPKLEGYVFLGWKRQYSYDWDWYQPGEALNLNSDLVLRAEWDSAYTSDNSYLITKETAEEIITNITEGTKDNPAIVRLRGVLDGEVIDIIANALKANPQVYFEVDLSGIIFNELRYEDDNNFNYCTNLVTIDLPQEMCLDNNIFKGCTSLNSIVVVGSGSSLQIINNALIFCDRLVCYPAGLTDETFEIPDNFDRIIGTDAFVSCSSLKAFNVSENNQLYKSIDGVLYSKDGKTLIKYPAGNQASSFTIPQQVETINPYAFADAVNLGNIYFEDTDSIWYRVNQPVYDKLELILYRQNSKTYTADSGINASSFVNYGNYYYQKINIDDFVMTGNTLTVYDSICYDGRDTTYTYYTFNSTDHNEFVVYKIPTVNGKSYAITTNESISSQTGYYGFDEDIGGRFNFTILSQDCTELATKWANEYIEFTAESDYTYIVIDGSNSKVNRIVIRVFNAPVITTNFSLSLDNRIQDIELWCDTRYYESSENNEYFYCYTTNLVNYDYGYAEWYVDGRYKTFSVSESGFTYELRKSELTKGIHLITVELLLERHGGGTEYYSASRQVVVE